MAGTWERTRAPGVYAQIDRRRTKAVGRETLRYKVRFRDASGKVRWSRSFDHLKDARDFAAQVRMQRRSGELPDRARASKTLDDLWAYYIETYTKRLATLQRHRDAYEDHVQRVFGGRRLDSLHPEEIETFLIDLQKRKSVSTRRHVHETFAAILNKGVKSGWIVKHPMRGIDRVADQPEEVRWLPVAEVEKLVAAVEEIDPRYRCYVWAAVETAARPGELLALRVKHIDGSIRIREALTEVAGVRRIGPPKTKDSVRNVPISPRLREELELHFASGYADPNDPEAFLFTDANGDGPLSGRKLRMSVITRAARNAGLGDVTLYTLRHTGISLRLMQGLSDWKVAKITGTSPAMIRRTYGHVTEHELQAEIDRLASLS